ncbi:GNAT family N-acetyltransferase [Aliagarivorans marinus]|uniref:GNAT family N-acetyltransferase n=1 Tax=Aliagarivorans marinus TaxID=561965 RepID=UPI0003FECA67|nr:GNAT family N-acetyltransferase [Aliagarivorans marinus]
MSQSDLQTRPFQINCEDSPSHADLERIGDGLDEHNVAMVGSSTNNRPLALLVRNEQSELIAGIRAHYNISGWLYITGLWVSEQLRRQGLGRALVHRLEREAIARDCKQCYLTTLDFQAPEFYRQLGYQQFAELPEFHLGHSKLFFRKQLRQ